MDSKQLDQAVEQQARALLVSAAVLFVCMFTMLYTLLTVQPALALLSLVAVVMARWQLSRDILQFRLAQQARVLGNRM